MDKKKQVNMVKREVSRVRAYQRVFNTPEGELVLQDLMKTHHFLGTTFDGDNVRKTIFREGERNVVLRILAILKMDVQHIQERIKLHEESV